MDCEFRPHGAGQGFSMRPAGAAHGSVAHWFQSTAGQEFAECSGDGRAGPLGTSYPTGAPPLSLLHAGGRPHHTLRHTKADAATLLKAAAWPAAGVNILRASPSLLQFPPKCCCGSASSAS